MSLQAESAARRGRLWAPNATVFVSSAAIMLIQLVSGRMIAQFVGQSLYTWTSIIGVTLAGIAIGNALGGRLADRNCGGRVLGGLFLIAGAAELTVFVSNGVFGTLLDIPVLPWPARIFLHVALVFLLPFACLGAISPMVTRRALLSGRDTGNTVGDIYAWSIAGSIAGTFLTGFFLLAWYAHSTILLVSAAILGAVGLAYVAVPGPARLTAQVPRDASAPAPRPATRLKISLSPEAATVFLTGAAGMAIELVAARMLARAYGSSLYTWTTIIGVILLGLSTGGYAGGRLADRFPARTLLASLLACAALASLVAPLSNEILRNYPVLWGFSWPVQILLHCLLAFIAPSILLGAVPPIAVHHALASTSAPGATVGRLYAWNSLGSIVGTFATGYVLISSLGVVGVMCCVVLSTALVALAWAPKSVFTLGTAAACLAAMAGTIVPLAPLESVSMNLALRPYYGPEIVYVDESNYAYIAVEAPDPTQPNVRNFVLDKLVHSKTDLDNPKDLKYIYTQIYAELLNHQHEAGTPVNVMAIGGGGFALPHYLELTRPGSYVEVSEIDPAVTEAAHAAFGLPRDTALHIFNMDARNRVADLLDAKRRGEEAPAFDFIFGDSINDYSVPYHVTTLEFTQGVFDLLTEDGVYMLNLVDMFDSGKFLGAFVNTCERIFPHVYVFSAYGKPDRRDTFIIAASRKALDLAAPAQRISERTQGISRLLSTAERDDLRQRSGGLVLTDHYAPVENLLAPVVRQAEDAILLRRILRADKRVIEGRHEEAIREVNKTLRQGHPLPEAYEVLGNAYVQLGKPDQAVEAYQEVLRLDPLRESTYNSLGTALYHARRFKEAAAAWEKSLELRPGNAGIHISLSVVLNDLKRGDEAIAHLRTAITLAPGNIEAYSTLAGILFRAGDVPGAIDALEDGLKVDPTNNGLHEQVATAQWRLKNYDEAWKHVNKIRFQGGPIDVNFLRALQKDSGRVE